MSSIGQGNALPGSVEDPRVVELLARWDELPGDLRSSLAEHPVHGPRLEHLRRVEVWLSGSTCPESEELYDFSRGPGYAPLPSARRQEIEDHLVHCGECESLVESLEGSPPLPLDLTGSAAAHAPDHARPVPHARPRRRARRIERWLPLAAAAAVLALGLIALRGGTVDAGDRWPEYPLLRGPAADTLAFPRDRVLAVGSVPGGGWAVEPHFELSGVPGASSYRVVLERHDGGAFGQGTPVLTLRGGLEELVVAESLDPGHYTWQAWAEVDGLERLVGERDFEVRVASEVKNNLANLSDLERVHALHDAGYWTDARALARRMPQSVGRDAYLQGIPGR